MPRAARPRPHRPHRGVTDDWITPRWLLDALGPFDLDPCACEPMPWRTAGRMLTVADDGLSRPWRGRVWLNPPFGPALGDWLARLAEHGDGVAIALARTETRAFHAHVWPAAAGVLFMRGRVHFHRPSGERSRANCGAPPLLIAYGAANAERLRTGRVPGVYLPLAHAATITGEAPCR